nr:YolD-like family protein [uncultured Campylobacter sp.]
MNKDRAKIFSSFNPLSTLEKALKAQEREKSEKLDLDESKIEEILNKISKLKPADEIKLTYHDGQGYANIEELVSNVNLTDKSLTVVKTKVGFGDVYEVRVVL